MIVFLSIFIGLMITIISLFMIKKEVMKASFFKHVKMNDFNAKSDEQIVEHIQRLENLIDEMNQSFYDIVSDLESKYSVHEKELQISEDRYIVLKNSVDDINSVMKYQGKELNAMQTKPKKPSEVFLNDRNEDSEEFVKLSGYKKTTHVSKEIKDEIMKLRALGLDEYQIARRLGKGVREIKLLMDFIK